MRLLINKKYIQAVLFLFLLLAISFSCIARANAKPLIIKPKGYEFGGGTCYPKAQCIQEGEEVVWNDYNSVLTDLQEIRILHRQISVAAPIQTFGYNKLMLMQVALNMTNATQYLPQILSDNLFNFSNGFKAFLQQARNRGVLDSMVYGYFGNSLTSNYGEIKSSFLRNIGVGIETNITYTTILKNANDFLDTITMNNRNNFVFEALFNKNFGKRHTIVTSSMPAGILIAKAVTGGNGSIPIHHRYQGYLILLRYQDPSLKDVNFYSLVHYLLYQIDYGHGIRKQISERLLSNIILRRFNSARRLLLKNSKEIAKLGQYAELYSNSNIMQLESTAILNRYTAVLNRFVKDAMLKYPEPLPAGYQMPKHGAKLRCKDQMLFNIRTACLNFRTMQAPKYKGKIMAPYPVGKKQLERLKLLKTKIKTIVNKYSTTIPYVNKIDNEAKMANIKEMDKINSEINDVLYYYKIMIGDFPLETPSYWKHPKRVPYIYN